MDPIEFRLLNGSNEGTRRVTGPRFPRIGYLDMLQSAKAHPHYTAPLEGPYRGRGVASGYWHNSTGPASAIVSVNADGTVNLVEGSMDIGGSRAAAAMHVAEVLGITVRRRASVRRRYGVDRLYVQTGGSSATFKTGWACYRGSTRRQAADDRASRQDSGRLRPTTSSIPRVASSIAVIPNGA